MGAPIHQSTQAESGEPVGGQGLGIAGAAHRQGVSPRDGYRLASRVYDTELNPILSLERRFLEPLLPPLSGLRVFDLGCGTGRWIGKLSSGMPGRLVGADLSPDMLAQAKAKLGDSTKWVVADCASLPFPRASADLILASFLASYVEDLSVFAEQVRRLLRPGGTAFVSDLHPETAARFKWRRGFRVDGAFVEVATHARSMGETLAAFEELGLRADAVIEPEFGEPELRLFERAGKLEAFHEACGHPAIYILRLSLRRHRSARPARTVGSRAVEHIGGIRVALGAEESTVADVEIADGRINFLGRVDRRPAATGARTTSRVDLSGFLLLPGLVNAHDHLEFALFPRLGRGGYHNFVEWADDIHHANQACIAAHRAVPKNVRLWWGGIRNLLCGVTTVGHHNPYAAKVFGDGFPVRVVREFSWAHSLAIDKQSVAKHKSAPRNQPFIIHLAEGVDARSSSEIYDLRREGALDERTVIVHGLGLEGRGMELLRSAGAALIWCPSSNVFLFGKTHDLVTITSLPRTALASDSPLTSQGDLLDEVRFVRETVAIPAPKLYALVTTSAAEVLKLPCGEGSLRVGAWADLIVVRDSGMSPADTLAKMSHRDVALVIVAGRIQLASQEMRERLPRVVTRGLQPLEVEGEVRWIRAPLERLFRQTQRHLGDEIRLGGKRIRYGLSN